MTPKEKTEYLKKLAAQRSDSFEDVMFNGGRDVDFGDDDPQFTQLREEHRTPMIQQITEMANRDPEMQEILRQSGVDDLSVPHPFRSGDWSGQCWREENNNRWIFQLRRDDGERKRVYVEGHADDPDSAKVVAARCLQGTPSGITELTESQKLHVIRLASQLDNASEAIAAYLAYSFPNADDEGVWDITTDPRYIPALNRAVFFVFENNNEKLSAHELAGFREFAAEFCGSRPLTIGLLNAAYERFKGSEIDKTLARFGSEENSAPTEQDIENMSDEEIESLRDSAAREYTRAVRQNRRR